MKLCGIWCSLVAGGNSPFTLAAHPTAQEEINSKSIASPFLGLGKKQMCEGCRRNSDCESNFCNWAYVCGDTNGYGANDCKCYLDTQCQSGRCSKSFICEDKVDNGGGCFQNNDCKSSKCGWDFTCQPTDLLCSGEVDIPFMITNVDLTKEGEKYYWGYHSEDGDPNELHFLKNIRYCPDAVSSDAYRIYGEPVGTDDFQLEVAKYLETNANKYDHVLYYIHGFNNEPKYPFQEAADFLSQNGDSKYLVIPINWRNYWSGGRRSYKSDRSENSPLMGKLLAQNANVFKSDYKASMMCHSQGNYVFRVFAQNVENPEHMFSNLFSVAADMRMDMFSTAFNPDAPKTSSHLYLEGSSDSPSEVMEHIELQTIDDELKPNGGYAMTLIAKNVHVIWNKEDLALTVREKCFQIGFPANIRKGLGKYGDQAEDLTDLKYFQERVHYHDFSQVVEEFGIEHNYQWYCLVVNVYKQYKECKCDCPEPEPCIETSITAIEEGMLLRGADKTT